MAVAFEATLGCLREKGLDVSVPPGHPGPGVNRTIMIVTEDYTSPKAAVTECQRQFMDHVEWQMRGNATHGPRCRRQPSCGYLTSA